MADLIVACGFAERCIILRGGAAAASMLRCKVVMGGMMLLADDYIDVEDAAVVTELHGKYYEQAYRGNVFTATMTCGVILPAPASTASNPITAAIGTPVIGTYGLFVNTNVVAAAVSGTALVVAGVIVRCETTIGGVTVGGLILRCAFAERGMMVRYGVTMGAVTVGDGFTEGGLILRCELASAQARGACSRRKRLIVSFVASIFSGERQSGARQVARGASRQRRCANSVG